MRNRCQNPPHRAALSVNSSPKCVSRRRPGEAVAGGTLRCLGAENRSAGPAENLADERLRPPCPSAGERGLPVPGRSLRPRFHVKHLHPVAMLRSASVDGGAEDARGLRNDTLAENEDLDVRETPPLHDLARRFQLVGDPLALQE